MRVACHQPYFLPALSFFAKWASADCLILLDELQFVRKSSKFHYANRCKLGDDTWYTIPTVRVFPQRICDVRILEGWQPASLLSRIRNDYRRSPHVEGVLAGITDSLREWQGSKLAQLNRLLLMWAGHQMGIEKSVYLQSELGASDTTDRDVRLGELVRSVGGDTYVAGPSGPKYMNEAVYRNAGLCLEVCHYDPRPYDRGARPWVAYMSVIDALCYYGARAAQYIEASIKEWPWADGATALRSCKDLSGGPDEPDAFAD